MKKTFYIAFFLFASQLNFAQINANFSTKSSDFTTTSKDSYTIVNSIESSVAFNTPGHPQLPILSRNYVLPAGSIVNNITFSNGNKVLLDNDILLYPIQPPCLLNGSPCPDSIIPDIAIYDSNAPFPAVTTVISSNVSTFGYSVVTINVCPFEYVPKVKELV